MSQILVIGAFDRFNYGDLLFPIIIEKELGTYPHHNTLNYYGIVNSDLSALGGKPTHNILDFYKTCNNGSDKVNVIIAGGEAIDATWTSLLAALNPTFQLFCRVVNKLNLPIDSDWVARKMLKGETSLPFTFSKQAFKNVNTVIFNSLGGSKISAKAPKKEKELSTTLEQVDYLAVRDKVTTKNLLAKGITAKLVPDSAILMSKFFPVEKLAQEVSGEIAEYVRDNAGEYLFFQINWSRGKGHEQELATNLDRIARETGTKICLCPIGTALNHDDQIALGNIRPLMKEKSVLFSDVNIWNIMYLIANSKAYMGTSLHGAITAMSFARPYVGISVLKLNSYLDSWGVEPLNRVVQINEMVEQFKLAIDVDQEKLSESRALQMHEVEKSFERMVQVLNN